MRRSKYRILLGVVWAILLVACGIGLLSLFIGHKTQQLSSDEMDFYEVVARRFMDDYADANASYVFVIDIRGHDPPQGFFSRLGNYKRPVKPGSQAAQCTWILVSIGEIDFVSSEEWRVPVGVGYGVGARGGILERWECMVIRNNGHWSVARIEPVSAQ